MPKPDNQPKFNQTLRDKIIELTAKGLSQKKVAQICNVSVQTINVWRSKMVDFMLDYNEARAIAADQIESAMIKSAKGHYEPETKVFFDSKIGECVEHKVNKYYPPNERAGIFLLSKYKPEIFGEKIQNSAATNLFQIIINNALQADPHAKEVIDSVVGEFASNDELQRR